MAKPKTSTTRLPPALREQLDDSNGNHHRRKPHTSRKEARKLERQSQKERKAEYFKAASGVKRSAPSAEQGGSPPRKKTKIETMPTQDVSRLPSSSVPLKKSKPSITTPSKKTTLQKMASQSKSSVAKPRRETEEDAYIAYLEGKLGYAKGKRKDTGDGLDDLLDFASTLDPQNEISDSEIYHSSEGEDNGDEWGGINAETSDDDKAPELLKPEPLKPTTAYVPPHLRAKSDDAPSEAVIRLTRQLKGLLNRMSEQNISGIIDSMEELYREHRRNDVTSTLTNLIIEGISSHSSLLDSYVVLYAAFVSGLHKIIGLEFAAFFVQTTVTSYENRYARLEAAEEDSDGKECSNLIVLLSELYNFQVISCVLVFDIIRGLLQDELTEFKIELLLKITRNSGHQLRQDDPSALKDIVQIVQSKVTGIEATISSRTRFMLETLSNLKNNTKRNATQNQGGDAVDRMKKFLTVLGKKKHVLAHEPLRVTLEDLHSAESKGKWWLIGAAWGGDPLVDRQQQNQMESSTAPAAEDTLIKLARKQGMNSAIRRSIFVVLMSSDDYVDACERLEQLSLTEIQQREIVRVLLHCCGNERSYNPYYTLVCQHLCKTSHSYKITLQFCLWDFLRSLGETSVGGAEILKNATEDYADFDGTSMTDSRLRNTATAYAWWIARDCVSLNILKPVDFTMLKPRTIKFLQLMFTRIFIDVHYSTPTMGIAAATAPPVPDRSVVEAIFIKGTRIQELAMGLVYYFSRIFEDGNEDREMQKFLRWAKDIAKGTLRTGMDIVPNL